MFELRYVGPTGSDCTAPYDVILNGEYTVAEFIKDALLRPREWGYIGIRNNRVRYAIFGDPNCAYSDGKLLSNLPDEYLTRKVISATASGGWSRMDFLLTLEE